MVCLGNKAFPCDRQVSFGTWNIEGLTDLKIFQLCAIMRKRSLGFLCLQETHLRYSGSRTVGNGYVLITSGSDDDKRTYAGVGFLVAPWLRSSIICFKTITERICYLKLRIHGGKATFFNAYAPHGGYDFLLRQSFFTDLQQVFNNTSSFGIKLLVGDMNARIHNPTGGEDRVFVPHCFGNPTYRPETNPDTNRELLLELCTALDLCVANTFFENSVAQQVTYHELWATPVDALSYRNFAQLDLVILARLDLWKLQTIQSSMREAFASHHFLVEAAITLQNCSSGTSDVKQTAPRQDLSAVRVDEVRQSFANAFQSMASHVLIDQQSLDMHSEHVIKCLHTAAEKTLPKICAKPRKPWIQTTTLELIEKRQHARIEKDWPTERRLTQQIKRQARKDRAVWTNDLLTDGSWSALKAFRRPLRVDSRKLRDENGELVESSERADTFATHLEHVQFVERPLAPMQTRQVIGTEIQTCGGDICAQEVKTAISQLKKKRAPIQVPAEYLQAVLETDLKDAGWLLALFQQCWSSKCIPSAWRKSIIVAIFKKGNPEECANYRPISLVSVLYKAYATILLNRLKAAGVEGRLWDTQFAFKRGCSTEDALFIVRRRVDQALALKGGRVFLLALDWQKAFDCIAPARLMDALRRFGIKPDLLQAIQNIYQDRVFVVRDSGNTSTERKQMAGISQGCPLSPMLFAIVMTIIMKDARDSLSDSAQAACANGDLGEALFADDTLIISTQTTHLEEYMAAITRCGSEYGLQVHWGKVHLLSICCDQAIRTPTGTTLQPETSMLYLGSMLHSDGRLGCEISRKIGAATASFNALKTIWRHRGIPLARKCNLFEALVMSKVLYGLSCTWPLRAEIRRLDGFQARCLRQIIGVKPAFISRVSNLQVREKARAEALSLKLKTMQTNLMRRVIKEPKKKALREVIFCKKITVFKHCAFVRRIGRPRQNWMDEVFKFI